MEWPSSFFRPRRLLRARGNLLADVKQDASGAGQGDAVVDRNVLERARGHVRTQSVAGVLHDCYTPMTFDFVEAGRAVVQPPGQDYPDHPGAIGLRGAAKQRVDRGADPVHAGAARENQMTPADQKMMVRGRNINIAGPD